MRSIPHYDERVVQAAERSVAGQQVVELVVGAGPDDGRGDVRVGDREGHREVGHREAGLLGEWDELFDDAELALVGEVLLTVQLGPVGADLLALAVSAGEQTLGQWAPDQRAHPVPPADRQDLAFDAPVDDRVRRVAGSGRWT
jgi:hypothetical protein